MTGAGQAAGLLRRLAAMVYDSLLVAAVLMLVTFLAMLVSGPEGLYPPPWWYPPLLLASWFAFFGWFWTRDGATLGMRAWHLRLVRVDGGLITWPRGALRFAAAALSFATLGLGFLWMLVDRKQRTLHDLLSGTRIVIEHARR